MSKISLPGTSASDRALLSQMRRDSAFLRTALDKAALVSVTNTRGTIIHANPKFCEVSGYSEEELLGSDHRLIKSDTHDKEFFRAMYRKIARGEVWHGEVCNRTKDGRLYWVDSTIVPHKSPSGKVTSYVSIRFDITRQKQAEETLRRHANLDFLTGLPNRAAMLRQLMLAVIRAKAGGKGLAFALLDVDNFKEINDSFGHSIGDELLQVMATRLIAVLGPTSTVARLGGDEFALILPDQAENPDFQRLINAVLEALREPAPIAGVPRATHASIGVAFCPRDGDDAAQLIKNADIALYRAKAIGGDRAVTYEPGMSESVERRMELRQRANSSLRQDEFELYYQPIMSLGTRDPNGLEALLRWRHPTLGLLAPGRFESVFEDPGLASAIGRFVLDRALDQAAAWTTAAVPFRKISINVSAADFRTDAFVSHFLDQLEARRLRPTCFCVEVTENIFLGRRAARIKQGLGRLHDAGVEIALDDFGTGHASLTDLRSLPIHRLKIDRSFVQGLCDLPRDRAIVTRLIQLAHDLGIRLTAEGVETTGQLDLLRSMGCDEVQGYLFSRPIPSSGIPSLLGELAKAA